jgi:hypothetical protein
MQKKNSFFHQGKTVEAASIHQKKPKTSLDNLQNSWFSMLKNAGSHIVFVRDSSLQK